MGQVHSRLGASLISEADSFFVSEPDPVSKALADRLISNHPDNPEGYIVRSCYLMDHDLPGRYETIHYFIDHFGDRDEFKSQVAEMRAYLAKHPEKIGQG